MVGRDDVSSRIDDSDLEKMLLNVVRDIDPQHHIGKGVRELLQIGSIDASMKVRVQSTALLDLGYARITLPSDVELGKRLLRMAHEITDRTAYNAVLDKVVDNAYSTIVRESKRSVSESTVPNLAYAFDLIQFAREEGLSVELNTFWYVPEGKKKTAHVVKSEQSPIRGAVRLDIFLKGTIIKDIQDTDYYYGENEDPQIIDMLKKAKRIGVPIQAEDIADIGYAKLLQGSRVDYNLRLIKIAEALGAQVHRVLSAVATEYQKLKTQPPIKA
ncbi:hypothetical protein HYY70_05745 [Candidatus Woesearchaeota archaeon]|nr:hypothetical protein [Candidatus Woesearchaeota archaeon]